MSELAGLFNLLSPFFGLILLGVVCGKRAGLDEAGLAGLQFFLIYLALPCLFFRLTAAKPIDEFANGWFVLGTTLSTAGVFAVSLGVSLRRGGRLAGGVMGGLAGAYSNIGYMGPPLVLSFLGPAAAAPVALVFVFDTLLLFSLVPALMAFAAGERRDPVRTALAVAWRIAAHPFMVATAIGLASSVLRWHPPAPVDTIVGWLSGAAAPCALFLLGLSIALRPVGMVSADVPVLVVVKLLLHPLVAWLVLSAIGGLDPVWIKAAIVMAALPPALNIFVVAAQYRVGTERASAAILVGTVVSAATLTAIIWIVETGRLPVPLFG